VCVGCEQILGPYDLDKGAAEYKLNWTEAGVWITVEEDGRNSCLVEPRVWNGRL